MWNVDERFEKKQMDRLASLGFSVGSTRGVVRVEKYGCGAEFRLNPDELFQMTILPTIMMKGQFSRLWDAGYQKFLLSDDGAKYPALAEQLANLRSFNEELRTGLRALGSITRTAKSRPILSAENADGAPSRSKAMLLDGGSFLQLTAKLIKIDAMFGNFARADKNDGNVKAIVRS